MLSAAIVTGATGGLGLATALGLARAGHKVVLAGRDPARGAAALAEVRAIRDDARFELLDMGSLTSIRAFADRVGPVGILVNNAGVMALPTRQLTEDGFERQLGVNYLGHFALTLLLLPALRAAPGGGRVVSVSSVAHRRGTIRFDDLQGEQSYDPWRAYTQSKLAMLMFARELERRVEEAGWPVRSVAAHPGWSATRIVLNGPGEGGGGLRARVMQLGFNMLAQSAADGALPLLFAALSPAAEGGGYYGPTRLGETRGPPGPARVMPQAADAEAGRRLWQESERLTGIRLTVP